MPDCVWKRFALPAVLVRGKDDAGDAIVAACNLNIFNNHSDKVVMANLAQAVNVLQALILTEGEKMVYYRFRLINKSHA